MRIALAQMQMAEDSESNYQKSLEMMNTAARGGAEVICFPELQFCRFFPQFPAFDAKPLAYTIEDSRIVEMQRLCKQLGIIAIPNFYLQENGNYFDASIVIDASGEIVGISKMVHIAHAPFFYEQAYYTPSDTGFKVYATTKGKIGIVVCFDRHYPESIRKCVMQGAEIIIVPTANTLAEPMELFEWEMRVAAYQNNVFIAMCNRCGKEDEMDFAGESLICHPNGDVVYKALRHETVAITDIALKEVEIARKQRPYIALSRPETY